MNFKIIYGSNLDECLDVERKIKNDLPGEPLFVTDASMLRDQLTTVACAAVVVTKETFIDHLQLDDFFPILKNDEIEFFSFIDGSLKKIYKFK